MSHIVNGLLYYNAQFRTMTDCNWDYNLMKFGICFIGHSLYKTFLPGVLYGAEKLLETWHV